MKTLNPHSIILKLHSLLLIILMDDRISMKPEPLEVAV